MMAGEWRTRARRGALAGLVGLAVLAGAASAREMKRGRADADFEWSTRLRPGQTLEVKGVNGPIVARGTSGRDAEVTATKRWKRSDPEDVTIEVVEHSGGVTICAVYPGKGNVCAPGSEGSSNVRNNDVQVEFTVRVPAGVRFAARTVNGRIEATDLDSEADVSTVNGSVEVATSAYARARTVNGSINAAFGSADWDDDLELKTVNGSVTLDLPRRLDTELACETVNGSIRTDFPVTVQGRLGKRRLHGTIGDGGRELTIGTVNGSIHLLASR